VGVPDKVEKRRNRAGQDNLLELFLYETVETKGRPRNNPKRWVDLRI